MCIKTYPKPVKVFLGSFLGIAETVKCRIHHIHTGSNSKLKIIISKIFDFVFCHSWISRTSKDAYRVALLNLNWR